MLLKVVCFTSSSTGSLAVHNNVFEELQNFMNYEIRELQYINYPLLHNIMIIVIHSWLIPDELASCMAPGF